MRHDGTEESLLPQSHRPKPGHPAKKGPEFARKAVALRRRNPGDPAVDVRARCRMAGLSMRCRTCLRILRREGFTEPYRTNPKRKHGRPCQTPPYPGDKRRTGVKFVPEERRAPGLEGRSCQCTVLDEASRRRYLRFSDERSMRETAIAFREAVKFFGYAPRVLQTDNGTEFSGRASRKEGAPGRGAGRTRWRRSSPATAPSGSSSGRGRRSTTARRGGPAGSTRRSPAGPSPSTAWRTSGGRGAPGSGGTTRGLAPCSG